MKTELCRLAAADGGEGVTLTLLVDGEKEKFTISADDYIELSLTRGEIEEATADELRARAAAYAARRAALRLIAAGRCSQKKLAEKLRLRHFSPEDAAAAAAFVAAHGYIDERGQVENYVETLFFCKGYGPRKIRPMLLQKGYAAEDIDRAIAEKITAQELGAAKAAFLQKKFGKEKPQTYEEAAAFRAALYRTGFY
ncbi:MAG: RecX family transcriptional regulator [Clostridia bacterium]|nr:RecX family transcriptional regulator [Clostridia bacterium]